MPPVIGPFVPAGELPQDTAALVGAVYNPVVVFTGTSGGVAGVLYPSKLLAQNNLLAANSNALDVIGTLSNCFDDSVDDNVY